MAYSTDVSREHIFPSDHLQQDPQQTVGDVHKSITPSPTDSLNALAIVAEHQLHDRQDIGAYNAHQQEQQAGGHDISLQDRTNMDLGPQLSYTEDFRDGEKIHRRLTRSASPSDAILIKRNAPMSLSSQTTPTSTTGMDLPYGLLSRHAESVFSLTCLNKPLLIESVDIKRI